MCDFHSTAWRLLGQTVEMCHLSCNSHSKAIEAAGWRVNKPNERVIVFEAEWSGKGGDPRALQAFAGCAEGRSGFALHLFRRHEEVRRRVERSDRQRSCG